MSNVGAHASEPPEAIKAAAVFYFKPQQAIVDQP